MSPANFTRIQNFAAFYQLYQKNEKGKKSKNVKLLNVLIIKMLQANSKDHYLRSAFQN